MIHFLPDADTVQPIASPLTARVDGLHPALNGVAGLGGAGAPNVRLFPVAGDVSRLADDLSERITAASAAGLEAIASLRDAGLDANPAAARLLADMIRDGLALGRALFLGRLGVRAPFRPAAIVEFVPSPTQPARGKDQAVRGDARSATRDKRLERINARRGKGLGQRDIGLERAVLAIERRVG